MTFKVIAAAALLRKLAPALRVRVVNVTDLMILGPSGSHPHSLQDADWDALFTKDKPIHFNYHGYPQELRGLLFGRGLADRVTIEGYREEGSTTTALDMMLQNHTSRYHVAEAAIRGASKFNAKVAAKSHELVSEVQHMAEKDREFIYKNGTGEFQRISRARDQFLTLIFRPRGHHGRPQVRLKCLPPCSTPNSVQANEMPKSLDRVHYFSFL